MVAKIGVRLGWVWWQWRWWRMQMVGGWMTRRGQGLRLLSLRRRLPDVLRGQLWILWQPIEEFLHADALRYLDSVNFEDVLLARSHLCNM